MKNSQNGDMLHERIQMLSCQEMRDTSTLILSEEKNNLIMNVNDTTITQYIDILPWKPCWPLGTKVSKD
jgi:hypothetical protein